MDIWEYATVPISLTITNLPSTLRPIDSRILQVGADGCLLPFRDNAFDIVFSNSVIEHVGNLERQRAFAREVARVGRRFWVQTPNRGFPVEQHLLVPFVHQIPKRWQTAVLNRFTGWEYLTRPTEAERQSYVTHFLNDIRLLGPADLHDLFPDAHIVSEKVSGITKSLIAVRAS
jgi:SAM-dependent methyltransferase